MLSRPLDDALSPVPAAACNGHGLRIGVAVLRLCAHHAAPQPSLLRLARLVRVLVRLAPFLLLAFGPHAPSRSRRLAAFACPHIADAPSLSLALRYTICFRSLSL